MKLSKRELVLGMIGLIFSVVPPLVATLSYFPIFIRDGSASVVSGIALLLILICAIPIMKLLKRLLDAPTARAVWIITFIAFFTLGRIADEMTVISFVGAVSNVIGGVFFAAARRRRVNEKQD